MAEYIAGLTCGDVIPVRITHLEPFGAFADIGCGIVSLLPIDAISVSRIDHPKERFTVGMDIRSRGAHEGREPHHAQPPRAARHVGRKTRSAFVSAKRLQVSCAAWKATAFLWS